MNYIAWAKIRDDKTGSVTFKFFDAFFFLLRPHLSAILVNNCIVIRYYDKSYGFMYANLISLLFYFNSFSLGFSSCSKFTCIID